MVVEGENSNIRMKAWLVLGALTLAALGGAVAYAAPPVIELFGMAIEEKPYEAMAAASIGTLMLVGLVRFLTMPYYFSSSRYL